MYFRVSYWKRWSSIAMLVYQRVFDSNSTVFEWYKWIAGLWSYREVCSADFDGILGLQVFISGWLLRWMNKGTQNRKETWNPPKKCVLFSKCFSFSCIRNPRLLFFCRFHELSRLYAAVRWWTPSSGTPTWSWEDSAQGSMLWPVWQTKYRINKNTKKNN